MKWLLLSRETDNPGDVFVRLGIEKLVRAADPDAKIRHLCTLTNAIAVPVEYDRAIWCGGPVLWSNPRSHCWMSGWWRPMVDGWLAKRHQHLMWYAVGTYIPESQPKPDEWKTLRSKGREMVDRSWGFYPRDKYVGRALDLDLTTVWCPSVFATRDYMAAPSLKLATVMPDGGHYGFMDEHQAAAWRQKLPGVVDVLKRAGFAVVCHDQADYLFAVKCGFKSLLVYSHDPRHLLDHYGRCRMYFGNRIHGALPARAVGADAVWCGYDTRHDMVDRVGGRWIRPSDLNVDALRAWATQEPPASPLVGHDEQWSIQLDIFRRFAANSK